MILIIFFCHCTGLLCSLPPYMIFFFFCFSDLFFFVCTVWFNVVSLFKYVNAVAL